MSFWCSDCGASPSDDEEDEEEGEEVVLSVYDVSHSEKIHLANDVLHKLGTGIFHAAVQVYGKEWSYGKTHGPSTGIFSCHPRGCKAHNFRESVQMGKTRLTEEEVNATIESMKPEWPGREYELLHLNCTHFSDEFCRRLGLERIPAWVRNLAPAGAFCTGGIVYIKNVGTAPSVLAAAKAGEVEVEILNILQRGKELRQAKPSAHYHFGDFTRGLVQIGRDVRHTDPNDRVHLRDLMAGTKAVILRKQTPKEESLLTLP
ncbi:unnamed protein product [Symbiodinium sp. CCMP2592]|nr:unnamed protein product [Symbiodinium sp. CCMP2592]